jgi:hypothetical protein
MGITAFLRKLTGAGAVDGFSLPADDPYLDAHALLLPWIDHAAAKSYPWEVKLTSHKTGKAIMESDRAVQAKVLVAAYERRAFLYKDKEMSGGFSQRKWNRALAVSAVMSALVVRQLPLSHEDVIRILRAMTAGMSDLKLPSYSEADDETYEGDYFHPGMVADTPLPAILRQVERYAAEHGLADDIRVELAKIRDALRKWGEYNEYRRPADKIDEMLGTEAPNPVDPGERWADALLADLAAMPSEERARWTPLLKHAADSAATKPSKKWLDTAKKLVADVGEDEFRRRAVSWLSLVPQTTTTPMPNRNTDVLRGLVWASSLQESADLARALGDVAEACFKRLGAEGLRSQRGANAAVYALSVMPGMEAVAQLARLKMRVKQRPAALEIEKAVRTAADRAGMTPDELEELTVPTFGLEPPGVLRATLGDYSVEAEVAGTRLSEWRWRSKDGKAPKSVPAQVKTDHGEEWKALKRTAGDLEKMLTAQRERIERLYLHPRAWSLTVWKERYLDHPLLASMSRRLIWSFETDGQVSLGIWHDGAIVDERSRSLDRLTDVTQVRLWHPIGCETERVLAWREWLEQREVVQPFKQAHREVYLLTDAELNTRVYSNRFAAHVLKQHQFNALCQQKGWRNRLQLWYDGAYGEEAANLDLPHWGLRAEFWVDAAGDFHDHSDSGAMLYLSTDQVRFCGPDGNPRPLTEVPVLVFSEVMRDVDMFVGVASVGNDPAWRDHGDARQFGDYWQDYSFGDLSGSAESRKEVLQRLVPRLKIADRCQIDKKFLVVKGDSRTYKIHLGSGNILMSPNDQYLCIVPGRTREDQDTTGVFLPFEGDRMLSIILSKAFLLAEDTKIKDPSITSQIKQG